MLAMLSRSVSVCIDVVLSGVVSSIDREGVGSLSLQIKDRRQLNTSGSVVSREAPKEGDGLVAISSDPLGTTVPALD